MPLKCAEITQNHSSMTICITQNHLKSLKHDNMHKLCLCLKYEQTNLIFTSCVLNCSVLHTLKVYIMANGAKKSPAIHILQHGHSFPTYRAYYTGRLHMYVIL